MRLVIATALVLTALAAPAQADACDTLISTLENGLANPGSTPFSKEQLERLLDAGRAAKQTGNVQACEAAMSSPAPASPTRGGKDCEKSQNTV
jgi:hypothetical protein